VNPEFRKVALIAASLGLLLSLFLVLRPDDDEEAAPTTTAATTTAPTTTATEPPPATTTEPPATTTPKPPDVVTIRITVPSDTAPNVRRYSVKQDRKVVIVVRTELSDHVHLHGYDLMADVGPGKPATIRFTATAPGRFELELEDRGLGFAELEVRP
jgi:hypothetical protein